MSTDITAGFCSRQFTRARLSDYVALIDRVVRRWWHRIGSPTTPGSLLHPAMKPLAFDIALVVFMGREPGADDDRIAKVHRAFAAATIAGEAILRFPVPPFKWWRGLRGRGCSRSTSRLRCGSTEASTVPTCSRLLCHAEDEDGNRFTDADVVNHMIFLMMAAVDAVTST